MIRELLIVFGVYISTSYGAPSSFGSGRIVGGSDAAEGSAPHQVALVANPNNQYFCGGAILTKRSFLTAAHCVSWLTTPSQLYVTVGSNQVHNGTRYDIEQIIMHPEWDENTVMNDIAVVIVKGEIIFSDRVSPIAIEESYIQGDEKVTMNGWGLLSSEDPVSPENLQTIDLLTYSVDKCKIANQASPWPITESHICTLTKRGEGICSSDSGSSLVKDGKTVGVVSWGFTCAVGKPDVYARVSFYADWIKAIIV